MANDIDANTNQPGTSESKSESDSIKPVEHHEEGENKENAHKVKSKKDLKHIKLEEEVEKLNDKYLRLYSEFDNYRKRTIKEKIELGKTASTEVISTLLPVIDDFERAIRAFGNDTHEPDPLKDGVLLIFNKLMTILTQQGLEQMKATGEVFNTDFHEAITNIPSPDPEMKGKVLDEVEKGYMLNGRVIRFAKVVVGS
jgi:molecular chaperone GrpE